MVEVPDGLPQRKATFLEQVIKGQAGAVRRPARQFHDESEIRPEESFSGLGTARHNASQSIMAVAVAVAVVVGDDQVLGVESRLDSPGQILLLLGAQQWGRENELRGVHGRNAATAR